MASRQGYSSWRMVVALCADRATLRAAFALGVSQMARQRSSHAPNQARAPARDRRIPLPCPPLELGGSYPIRGLLHRESSPVPNDRWRSKDARATFLRRTHVRRIAPGGFPGLEAFTLRDLRIPPLTIWRGDSNVRACIGLSLGGSRE